MGLVAALPGRSGPFAWPRIMNLRIRLSRSRRSSNDILVYHCTFLDLNGCRSGCTTFTLFPVLNALMPFLQLIRARKVSSTHQAPKPLLLHKVRRNHMASIRCIIVRRISPGVSACPRSTSRSHLLRKRTLSDALRVLLSSLVLGEVIKQGVVVVSKDGPACAFAASVCVRDPNRTSDFF